MLREQDCAIIHPEEPKKLSGKIRHWNTLTKLVTRTATLCLAWAIINGGTAYAENISAPTTSALTPEIYSQERVGIYLLSKSGQPPTLSRENIKNSLRRNLAGAAPSALDYWNRYTDGALSDMPLQFYPETGFLEIDNSCSNSWFEGEVVDKATRISTDFNPTVMVAVADNNLGCGSRGWTKNGSWSQRPGVIIVGADDLATQEWEVIGHELGHVFGAGHASVLYCPDTSDTLSNCSTTEYAWQEGVMGNSRQRPMGDLNKVQTFQLLRAFNRQDPNPLFREMVKTIATAGEYNLSCAPFRQGQSDIQLLKIPHIAFGDNNTDWTYWIGCRPLQPEPTYNLNLPANNKGGISLYLTPQDTWDTPTGYPYYNNIYAISQQHGVVLHPGQVSRLIGSQLGSLKVLQINDQSAVVQIGQNLRSGFTVFLPSLLK